MGRTDHLKIRNFAQIAEADLTFGDLTVLVGAQGTGKSLALQWLKVVIDGRQIVTALRDAGHSTGKSVLVDLIFGAGKNAARQQLARHLRPGVHITAWLWVASGRVHFADTEKARRRLDQHGIRFVGGEVLAKHLPPVRSTTRLRA